jgi:hypothetical protein
MPACVRTQTDPIHRERHRSPKMAHPAAANFGILAGLVWQVLEPVEATSVSYRGTAPADKMRLSIRDFPHIA